MALKYLAQTNLKAVSIIISGITGIVAQVVLLRELLVSFQGNELSLGIILANWLLFEALGSYLAGRWAVNLKNKEIAFAIIQILVIAGLVVGIYIARSARVVLGLPVGQGLGVDAMFIVSLLALLPVSLPHGASFTLAGLVLSNKPDAPGKTYVYENLGTMAGGLLVTFALIPFLNSLEIALIMMFFSIIAASGVLWGDFKMGFRHGTKAFICIAICVVPLITLTLFHNPLHKKSLDIQWTGQNLVSHQNSVYGNIAVVEQGGEYTFFTDGQPIITTPMPNLIRLEEFVHFTMLSHPDPRNIAVLTGGAGGKINEILKYPEVISVDYVELDPLLFAKLKQFSTWLTNYELTHPKVQLHYDDGRYFMQQTNRSFDVCIIGVANPSDLQTNRFFTIEFYQTIRQRLNPGGVLAVSLPSLPRAQLFVEGLAMMNKSAYATLKRVFDYVRVFPGEGYNIFLASDANYIKRTNASTMSRKIEEKGIDVVLLYEPYIEYRTLPWWNENFYASIYGWENIPINKDFEPRVVFESMMYFSAMFTPRIAWLLEWVRNFGAYLFAGVILLLAIFAIVFKKRGDIPLSIFTTGFAGMLLDLVLIFAFQALFGYVFYWIGILVSVFMAGAAIAALKITHILPTIKFPAKLFIKTDIAVMVMCIMLPLILVLLHSHAVNVIPDFVVKGIFVLLSLACGLLVGAQYPLACHILKLQGKHTGKATGLLYGLDLFGGWVGGVAGGLFLIPLLGIVEASIVLAGVKACTVLILIFIRRNSA